MRVSSFGIDDGSTIKLILRDEPEIYYGLICKQNLNAISATTWHIINPPKSFSISVYKLGIPEFPPFLQETATPILIFNTPAFSDTSTLGGPFVQFILDFMRYELSAPEWFPEEEKNPCI